uniref:Uncharacterized protein n=1 Tax=Auxenochlorella protothecoides TaxID=3075 RepID=A0A1D2AFF6_AUXPR
MPGGAPQQVRQHVAGVGRGAPHDPGQHLGCDPSFPRARRAGPGPAGGAGGGGVRRALRGAARPWTAPRLRAHAVQRGVPCLRRHGWPPGLGRRLPRHARHPPARPLLPAPAPGPGRIPAHHVTHEGDHRGLGALGSHPRRVDQGRGGSTARQPAELGEPGDLPCLLQAEDGGAVGLGTLPRLPCRGARRLAHHPRPGGAHVCVQRGGRHHPGRGRGDADPEGRRTLRHPHAGGQVPWVRSRAALPPLPGRVRRGGVRLCARLPGAGGTRASRHLQDREPPPGRRREGQAAVRLALRLAAAGCLDDAEAGGCRRSRRWMINGAGGSSDTKPGCLPIL